MHTCNEIRSEYLVKKRFNGTVIMKYFLYIRIWILTIRLCKRNTHSTIIIIVFPNVNCETSTKITIQMGRWIRNGFKKKKCFHWTPKPVISGKKIVRKCSKFVSTKIDTIDKLIFYISTIKCVYKFCMLTYFPLLV